MDANALISVVTDDNFSDEIRGHLRPFTEANFDPQNFARDVLQQSVLPLAEHLAQIDASIAALNNNLKNRVLDDHELLTSNITAVDALETSLIDLENSSRSLLSLTGETLQDYQRFYNDYSKSLEEYQSNRKTIHLARKTSRILQTARKIRDATGKSDEHLQIALAIIEMGDEDEFEELLNVKQVAGDLRFVRETRAKFPHKLVNSLKIAVEAQNNSNIEDIIDASLTLHKSSELLTEISVHLQGQIKDSIEKGLDIDTLTHSEAGKAVGRTPGRTTLPSVQNTPALRTAFWNKIEALFDVFCQNQARVELLESIYLVRYENFALYSFDAVDIQEGRFSGDFLRNSIGFIKTGLEICGQKSSFLQQILENEYPRLLKTVKDALIRLKNTSRFLDFSEHGEETKTLRNSIGLFQELFISRSLSRLLDPVNISFSDTNSPVSNEDVDNILRAITNELVICASDEILGILICKNVGKSMKTVFIKLDEAVDSDGEATQVIGPLTGKQQKNFRIIKSSVYLKEKLEQRFNVQVNIPEQGRNELVDALRFYEKPVQNVLQPLVSSLLDSVESILLTMHQEDFSMGEGEIEGNSAQMLEAPCSQYMKELQNFLARAQQIFISPLEINIPLVRSYIVKFAQRCLELFVRHISLIRPVGKQGRLKLATDCAQLEAALAPFNLHNSEYGLSLQILKAFRPLFFQTPEQIVKNGYMGSVLPYSVVLHHLFSRAPVDMPSPYQVSDWSISRYSKYLDDHPKEEDRLTIVKASLDNYANAIRSRGETHYAVIYPLMRELLNKAFDATH